MATIKKAPRVFKMGATLIDDPLPGKPLAEAVEVLSQNYPQFRWTRLYERDADMQDGKLVYTLQLAPNKTNG